jgi:hypothetical protein
MLLALLALPAAAMAGIQGADFDNMPLGPYTGSASIWGDPSTVNVEPNAAGNNSLHIDNSNGSSPVYVTFTYDCDDTYDDAVCQIKYDFYFVTWWWGGYVGVYVDDPDALGDPDDWQQVPVAFPPSTSEGSNSEREPDCEGQHTITFVVGPGAEIYLDNFETECLDTVANDTVDWGAVKSMYQ